MDDSVTISAEQYQNMLFQISSLRGQIAVMQDEMQRMKEEVGSVFPLVASRPVVHVRMEPWPPEHIAAPEYIDRILELRLPPLRLVQRNAMLESRDAGEIADRLCMAHARYAAVKFARGVASRVLISCGFAEDRAKQMAEYAL